MAKVSIVKCASYNSDQVDAAVDKALQLLGGLAAFIKPGQRVLLKVNALMGADPATAATTHPSIVTAVVKAVKKAGGIPLVGDSPGDASANIEKTMQNNGITAAVEKAGGQMINFHESGSCEINSPSRNKNIPKLRISKAVLDAGIIINLPKLKTHNFTRYTGAIKNLFGCIPGFTKATFHALSPHPAEFSKSLVDILEIVKPTINIMDAVYGMEGSGPTSGPKRHLGAIFASADAVALDAVASAAIGFDPLDIYTTKIAYQRKLGEGDIAKVAILGTSLSEIEQKDWQHPGHFYGLPKYIPAFAVNFLRPFANLLRINPVIDQTLCRKCLICLKNCPAQTIIQKNNRLEIQLKKCIMCFCCHELCPHKAIHLQRSWLAKLMGIGAT